MTHKAAVKNLLLLHISSLQEQKKSPPGFTAQRRRIIKMN